MKDSDKKKQETETGLYVIYDVKAELNGPVFEAVNHAVAARNVRQMEIQWPEDYELHYIGKRQGRTIFQMMEQINWQIKDKEKK